MMELQNETDTTVSGSAPTVADDAARLSEPGGDAPAPTLLTAASASTAVAAAALDRERDDRGRAALRGVTVIAFASALLLQLVTHKTLAHWLLTGAAIATGLAAVVVLASAPEGRIGQRRMMIVGTCGIVCVLAGIAYIGVLSPTVVILYLAIYFWGSGDLPSAIRFMYSLAALGYLVLALLAWFEVLPLQGSVLALANENKRALIGFTVLLEAMFVFTVWLAHQGRKATLYAVEALERARRQVQHREALLHEARADLERARDAGKLGRFTGRQVGSFVASDVIGRGAMGEVYEAQTSSGDPAALKVLHPYLFGGGAELERFLREAQVASRLESPHVVRVLESGRAEDGSPFFAMELLRGSDLASLLRERRRLELREVLTLATHVADALGAAQEAGVVHRDIKPQNLFLTDDTLRGRIWKVLDFGVSKIGEEAVTLTRGAAVGTPGYMAPEQARGQSVDHRADVFSLGAVVYRALTGRPAFSAADSVATLYQVAYVQPARPSDLVELHRHVELVLALALAKQAQQRFHSARTFAAALRDASRGELDEPFRQAATALIVEHPWGTDSSERR